LRRLPQGTRPVAVAYADWREAGAPEPSEVLREGAALGCTAALLDTYAKQAGGLFDHLPSEAVVAWLADARQFGMLTVLAGSLDLSSLPTAMALGPDFVAVRGAVCRASRRGELDPQRLADFRACLCRE